jgi:hypothetical protein
MTSGFTFNLTLNSLCFLQAASSGFEITSFTAYLKKPVWMDFGLVNTIILHLHQLSLLRIWSHTTCKNTLSRSGYCLWLCRSGGWIGNRVYWTRTLVVTIQSNSSRVYPVYSLLQQALNILGLLSLHQPSANGFQRRTILLLWVRKISPCFSDSNSLSSSIC